MEQHPIPQNVSQYQFRLIGNLNLKQFALLGGCLLLAFIISKISIIPFFFRYPLVGLFVTLGLAMAFLPFEERSLDVWLINFLKSIYNPTHYIWKATGDLPDFMQYKPGAPSTQKSVVIKHNNPGMIDGYIRSISAKLQNPIDKYELDMTNKLSALFATNANISNTSPATLIQTRVTNPEQAATMSNINMKPVEPANKPPVQIPNYPPSMIFPQNNPDPTRQTTLNQTSNAPANSIIPTNTGKRPIITNAEPIGTPLKIKGLVPDTGKPPSQYVRPTFYEYQAPPAPDIPNTIAGVITTTDGQLAPNVIIEIRDAENMPVRAIKTNRLGQFFVATPLPNGNYTLIFEHDLYKTEDLKIELRGNIVPPLKIVANIT